MRCPKIKFIIFPFLTLLFLFCRNFLHYILLLYGLENVAAYLVFPNETGIASDILLGFLLTVMDYYGFRSDYSRSRTLGHLLRTLLVLAILIIGLCIFPYNRMHEIFGAKVLSPIFSLLMQGGISGEIGNMDTEILRDIFYWHFFWDEITFIEWIVTYLVFQGCTQIAFHKQVSGLT